METPRWVRQEENLLSKRETGWHLRLLKVNMHLVSMQHKRMCSRIELNLEKCILQGSAIVTAGIHMIGTTQQRLCGVCQFDWIPLQYRKVEVSTDRRLEPPLQPAKSEIVLSFKWCNA